MSPVVPVTRQDVIAMLSEHGDTPVDAVGERIDSMQLAWLIHQVEQRHGIVLDLSDDLLDRMTTVSDAVAVLANLRPPSTDA